MPTKGQRELLYSVAKRTRLVYDNGMLEQVPRTRVRLAVAPQRGPHLYDDPA